jgi:two-component sensor histidine kinase
MGKPVSLENRFYFSKKLIWIVTLFIIAASGLVVLTNFSINVIAASGNYTSLLAKWSSYHHQAGIYIEQYGQGGDTKHYKRYLQTKEEKDQLERAITELFKNEPKVNVILNAFNTGQIYPNEVSSLIFAFNQFSRLKIFQNIRQEWRKLSDLEASQKKVINKLRNEWHAPDTDQQQIKKYLSTYHSLNQAWNSHNHNLMAEVDNASLTIKRLGLWISVILGILLVLIGVVVSVRANKSICRWESALKEKEILLSEIHHRVKNNLAVISSLLELESMYNRNPEQALKESRDRIKSMAMIHEILYQSKSFSEINLASYVQLLTDYISKTYIKQQKQIELITNFEDINLNINQAVPVGLILNEMLANAIEHGFKSGNQGEVVITLREHENQVALCVQDNGKGLPQNFDPEKADTTGFTIINALVKQLKGDLKMKNGNGTTFKLEFFKSDAPGSRNANL